MTPPKLLASLLCAFVFIGLAYLVVGWVFGGGDTSADSTRVVEGVTLTPAPHAPGETAKPKPPPTDGCAPAIDESFLSANQMIGYYGSPYAEGLGILGQHSPQDISDLLREHAAALDQMNGFRGVQPAFHVIYETAQPNPGENGLYLNYVDDDTMQTYFDVACRDGLFVFLDLQIARSTIPAELEKIKPYLLGSNVHIAIDPEFNMQEGEVPGKVIGHVDAERINAAQQILEEFVEANDLPDKVLIVHEFDTAMITDPRSIADFPHVQVVIDMDGFGPKETKIRKFNLFTAPAQHSGIKIFYKQDTPAMSDEEVQALNPDLIIFQ